MSDTVPARVGGSPGSPGRRPGGGLLIAALLGVASIGLAALIVTNKSSIVTLGPANANASLNAAWQVARDPAASPAQLADAEAKADRTLAREPLNTVAMSLIGAIRERQGNAAQANALMTAADEINHRENIADLWLFDHLLSQHQYDQAFIHADSLLRRDPGTDFTGRLFPQMVNSLNDPAAIAPLAGRLAKSPQWRVGFTDAVIRSSSDPGAPAKLLLAIKAAHGSISAEELSTLLTRLVEAKRYDEAYLDWIIFLPDATTSKLTYVYDGDFAGLPDTLPFGWNFSQGVTGLVEAPPDRADPALHVTYDGTPSHAFPAQLLVIPPGRYDLVGEVMTATPSTAGQLQWVVQCVGQPDAIASAAAPNTAGQWVKFSATFTVPAGCSAQTLALKAINADHKAEVDIWYDKLNVQPAGATS